jgi:UDP-N-acetylmuramate--alanine ligase
MSNLQQLKHVHFIGIGGAGMSGIAEIALGKGYQVSGSDNTENATTQRLQALGIKVFLGHKEQHIQGDEIIVFSSAIAQENPELVKARRLNLPLLHRAQMLAELMKAKCSIAIAGSHGKTTTTGIIASLFLEADLDPTFAIGSTLLSTGSNARVGAGDYFVIEADESDASFLYYAPDISIITNIDADHLNNYRDFNHLQQTFLQFLQRLPTTGLAIACSDDPILASLLSQIERPLWTYGFKTTDQVRCLEFQQQGTRCQLQVQRAGYSDLLSITLNLPGRHNVLNALSAIAVAMRCNIPDAVLLAALAKFAGTGRRFQMYGEFNVAGKQITLLDDYGHHPREIAVTLQAMRQAWPERRLVLAFQPHRYTRTADLFQEFVEVLAQVDVLLLLDIYPAGESPLPNISGKNLFDAIVQQQKNISIFVETISKLPQLLPDIFQTGDVLLLQGAGDIGKLASQLATFWSATLSTKVQPAFKDPGEVSAV